MDYQIFLWNSLHVLILVLNWHFNIPFSLISLYLAALNCGFNNSSILRFSSMYHLILEFYKRLLILEFYKRLH